MFEPTEVENLGMLSSSSTLVFLLELGRRISSQTGDVRESSYLFQRISVAIQRFNSVLLHDRLTVNILDSHLALLFLSSVLTPGGLYYLG